MQKSLVIVESPAKAKTLGKYLGPGFEVLASVGHIKNLPESKLGVDVDAGFEPQYKVIPAKRDVLKRIKKSAEEADAIYLAPDPDREGEAIAFHLAQEIGGDKPVHRILIHEIIKSAVERAIANPGTLDVNKYQSQQARRVLDRLVGYLISPILWEKVRRGLSAGRVQSVAVRLVVDREREISAFVPMEYWTLHASVEGAVPPPFECRLHRMDGGDKVHIPDARTSDRLVSEVRAAALKVSAVTRKERRRNPSAPFITSTLQQEAARKLGFNAKRTMKIAQELYEGVEIGQEGPVGLITYMRTDSTRLSDESLGQVRAYIGQTWGPEAVPEEPRQYKNRKSSQDAHEAIRVTAVERVPQAVAAFLTKDQARLYELVWKRFVASQMQSAVYDAMTVDIEAGPHTLRATGSQLKSPGFMAVYIEGDDAEEGSKGEEQGLLPDLAEGVAVSLKEIRGEQHFTQPPPRYTEASLIRELEERGIGRPSTYASILTNISDRHYVEREGKQFRPTELGVMINDMLISQFPDLFSESFTASMEEELDRIAEGDVQWKDMLQGFYKQLSSQLDQARDQMQDLKKTGLATEYKCEECGSDMVVKWGRNGQFLACTGFPECKNTKEVRIDVMGRISVEQPEKVEKPCPECGAALMVKRGKFGKFLACTNYPTCKFTENYGREAPSEAKAPEEGASGNLQVGQVAGTCDNCGKDMVVKRSRFGLFLACTGYPECKATKRIARRRRAAGEAEESQDGAEA